MYPLMKMSLILELLTMGTSGIHLRPLAFIMYRNDLPFNIKDKNSNANCYLYADDIDITINSSLSCAKDTLYIF